MKTMIKSLSSKLVALAIICFMASCTNSDEPAITDSKSSRIDITLAEQAIAEQSNQFAWRLLEECKGDNDENIVLSPLSANLCLSMLANATGGNSRSQLLDALGYAEKDIENVNSLNQKLASQICGIDKNVKIALANSVWYDAQINPYPDFMNRLLDNYNILSFCINHNTFGRDVNDWCKNNTYGLIPKIIEETVDKDFALINALYFKGNWNKAFKFNVKDTQRSEFTNADGSKSHVDYMCMHREYDYYSADNWQAARIPFGGGGFQFTVILPDRGVSIDDCMESICQFQSDDQMFNQIILDLMLPKFKISHETDMIEALMRMGVVDIFDEYSSDFSGMTDFKIIIDLVKQSVNFELNEDGAEAAAVTIVGGDLAVVNNEKEFYIDRPFLFMISENSTGAILFMGRINKF